MNVITQRPEPSDLYGFRLPRDPLPHQRFKSGLRQIGELHHAVRTHQQGGGFLLMGASGAGKSTLIGNYAARFPIHPKPGGTAAKVLLVTVPSAPTAKSLGEAILMALGYKKAHSGSAPYKLGVIIDFFKKCDVEVLIFDEFHHLFYAPSVTHFRDVTDWLKNLISLTNIAVVGCGLPEAEAVVAANEQLSRRFSARFNLVPFSFESDDFDEFRSILKTLQAKLPVGCECPLHEANMARRFLVGSHGLLDYVTKILEGAIAVCARTGQEQIDLAVLAEGFRDRVWREVPDKLNPFHPESYLRPLDKPGEVFYLHVGRDVVGSAVAKRIKLNNLKGGH